MVDWLNAEIVTRDRNPLKCVCCGRGGNGDEEGVLGEGAGVAGGGGYGGGGVS